MSRTAPALTDAELLACIPACRNEDVRQDIALQLLEARPSSAEEASIIIDRCLYRADWARHQAKRRDMQLLDELDIVADQEVSEVDHLAPLLASLMPDERELIALRYLDGMTAKELGSRLGISQPTLRKRLDAVLYKLRTVAVTFQDRPLPTTE